MPNILPGDDFRTRLTQLMIDSGDVKEEAQISDYFVIVRTMNMTTGDTGMGMSMSSGNVQVIEGMLNFGLRRVMEVSDAMWDAVRFEGEEDGETD